MSGTKRSLATPEKGSPSWRKVKQVQVNSPEIETSSWMRQPKKSRKSLAFTRESSSMSTLAEKEEEMLKRVNIDDWECYCKNSTRRSNQNTGERPSM